MLVKGKNVIGLDIISIDEGKKIGSVEDIIYDPEENKVEALLVRSSSLFKDAQVILLENVNTIGKNAVMIQSEQALQKSSNVDKNIAHIAEDNTYLTRTKVVTEQGVVLGTVSDIYFDAFSGKVIELEVSQGTFRNLQSGIKRVKVSDIITIGEDATIVKSYTEESFTTQAQEQGIQGILQSVTDKIPGVTQSIKQKAEELTTQEQQKFHNTRSQLYQALDIAENKWNEFKTDFSKPVGTLGGESKHTPHSTSKRIKGNAKSTAKRSRPS